MKSWLSLYRLSTALDQQRGREESAPATVGSCPAAEELRAADSLLRAHSKAACSTPVCFHGSIMRAVQAGASVPRPRVAAWPRWAPAPGLAAVLVAGLFWAILYSKNTASVSTPEPLESASSALVIGNQLAQTAPASLAKPISDELERVNRDIKRTTEFLFSSLP